MFSSVSKYPQGRAIAQVVSCWLLTVSAQVLVWAEHVGFVVDRDI
jgi:hypothetical protein